MTNWIVRGLAFTAGIVVLRLFQGALINAFQTQAGLVSLVLILLFVLAVVVWGLIDGRADARANPDPDRRGDLAMTWLLAGLLAGILGGLVIWLISLVYANGLYTGGLINEVTTFAAFTALLVFLPAMGAVTVGRYLIDRKGAYAPRASGGDDDRADTDVFDAVHDDQSETQHGGGRARDQGRTEAAAGQQSEERAGGVATAEGERPTQESTQDSTQEGPTTRPEEKTQPVRTDDRTETIRTDDHTQAAPTGSDAEQTRPTRTSGDDQR